MNNAKPKSDFKNNFIVGMFWGASVVFFVAAIFYFGQFRQQEATLAPSLAYLTLAVALDILRRTVSKKLGL
jgi:hypothetical protein